MNEFTIGHKVEQAFADAKALEYVEKYLDIIRENMRTTEEKFQHSFYLVLLLMGIFELMTEAAISEVTIGPIKLSDLRLFQKLLPVVVAFMYYSMVSVLAMRRLQRETHDQLLKRHYEPIFQNDLEYYLIPASNFVTEEAISKGYQGFLSKLVDNLSLPLMLIVVISPIVFEIYAFTKNFASFGASDLVWWISAVLASMFVTQGFLILIGTNRLTGD